MAPTVNISLSFQTQKYMTALPDDELRAVPLPLSPAALRPPPPLEASTCVAAPTSSRRRRMVWGLDWYPLAAKFPVCVACVLDGLGWVGCFAPSASLNRKVPGKGSRKHGSKVLGQLVGRGVV